MSEKLDLLAFGAHPDDVEISAGGSVARFVDEGMKVGICDLTRGELGSRGSAALRKTEAENAAKVLGIHARENLGMKDGFIEYTEKNLQAVIKVIRKYRPRIILCTAPTDRHPDHGRSSKLIQDACFYSGLSKIETTHGNSKQEAWRPNSVYSYIQDYHIKPDFVLDVEKYWDQKIESLKCYSSQFYSAQSNEPATPISGKEFFDFLHGRAMQMGRPSGFILAEGFIAHRTIGVHDINSLC